MVRDCISVLGAAFDGHLERMMITCREAVTRMLIYI